MLKRRGGRHHPPTSLSTNKRPRVQPASRLLQESVFAWRNAADLPARERAALDHFALLKEQAHKQLGDRRKDRTVDSQNCANFDRFVHDTKVRFAPTWLVYTYRWVCGRVGTRRFHG